MKKILLYTVLCFALISCNIKEKKPKDILEQINETITEKDIVDEPNIFVVKTRFPSKDGLTISADLYEVNSKKPTILLCHQAGFSRGEYIDTAIKLNNMGYSCLAIDQRSGKIANAIENETAILAKEKGLPTTYLDAKQDIEAAINYIYDINGNQPILLVGSSYSASLVLLIGKENNKVKAVAAFSPGEYLKGIKMSDKLQGYKKPVFVTSSKDEIDQIDKLNIVMTDGFKFWFKPLVDGIHGSRALWESTEGNDKYWEAFETYLGMLNEKPKIQQIK